MPLQKALGKALAGLEHRRALRGTKDAEAALLKRIHNAQRERQLRSNNSQPRLLGFHQAHHGVQVFGIHRNAACNLPDAAVARRANHFSHPRAARNRPGQRVLAPPGTKDQDFHRCIPSPARAKPEE